MKITDDDETAAEEGFRVLSVKCQKPMLHKGSNVFTVRLLECNSLRIGLASKNFQLDHLIGEDRESWCIISTGDVNHNGNVKKNHEKNERAP